MSLGAAVESAALRAAVFVIVLGSATALGEVRVARAEEGSTAGDGQLQTTRLDPVVVTATRTRELLSNTPQTVTVITEEEIAEREDATIPDVLRQVVGLDVVQAGTLGTQASVFIRGSDSDQVLTLIDGVQLNSSTLGAFDFANVAPEPFERIEILRGGGGSLYGSEAVGGVINFITRRGRTPGFATISGAGGNGQTDRETATFAGTHGRFGFAGAATHIGTAGFGPPAPLDESGTVLRHNTAYDATTASLQSAAPQPFRDAALSTVVFM